MKNITLLGSTGTIGQNVLEIVRKNRDKFNIVGLACSQNKDSLSSQIIEFRPVYAFLWEKDADFSAGFPDVTFLYGEDGLIEIASLKEADLVIGAIPGIQSLRAILESLKKGKTVGLATKEIMVVAGELIMQTAERFGGKILPVDSEHNAIFQMLEKEDDRNVKKIYLTASGGPFLGKENLDEVEIHHVLDHPVWKMGEKITVDSATLMNKALEVIEAYYLFSLAPGQIDVLIHPEAVIHGLIELKNGFMKGVFSVPNMKFAIDFVLNYPEIGENQWGNIDLATAGKLTFQKPAEDAVWFSFAKKAISKGGSYPVVLNGANEEAVTLFLEGKIKFSQILHIVGEAVDTHPFEENIEIKDIYRIHNWAKQQVREIVRRITCSQN